MKKISMLILGFCLWTANGYSCECVNTQDGGEAILILQQCVGKNFKKPAAILLEKTIQECEKIKESQCLNTDQLKTICDDSNVREY